MMKHDDISGVIEDAEYVATTATGRTRGFGKAHYVTRRETCLVVVAIVWAWLGMIGLWTVAAWM